MNQKLILVSIIVPTLNNEKVILACLKSIRSQTYKPIELIIVDNFSTDSTRDIAKKFADKVFTFGPERSAQRNYGVSQANGQFVLLIDSDMVLGSRVIAECVQQIKHFPKTKGLIVPEVSFGQGFWAECKKLEKSFYLGVDWMEAARFFDKNTYLKLGGYNAKMISGEDWDLSNRLRQVGKVGRIKELIYHNEGELSLTQTIRKKFYYARKISHYLSQNKSSEVAIKQTSIVKRYGLFFSKPLIILKHPLIWLGMILMKTLEFLVGGIGMVWPDNIQIQPNQK